MIESMKPTCGVILILVSAFIAVPALATEKYTIARYTDIAVVGKFSDVRTARHFHGWRLTGNLIVEESLYGSIPQGTRLYYEFDCLEHCGCLSNNINGYRQASSRVKQLSGFN